MRKILLLCVAMAVMLTPTLALADRTSQAREAYRKGREAYKAGNYRESLVFLKKAYKLKPMPALLRYTGETYYKMNQAQEAIKHFRLYLKAAPMAADRAKVESKVRQLELIVGPGDEEEDEEFAPPPPPPPPPMPDDEQEDDTATAPPPPPDDPEPAARPKPRPKPRRRAADQPLGEDDEDPLLAADRRRKARERSGGKTKARRGGERRGSDSDGSSGLFIGGATSLGIGAACIIVGGVMVGLANGKASELQDIVKSSNPNMNAPTVSYSKQHHDLVTQHDSFNNVGVGMFVAGGVAAGTGVVLLIVNAMSGSKKKADSGARRVVFAPVIGSETLGMTGQVRF